MKHFKNSNHLFIDLDNLSKLNFLNKHLKEKEIEKRIEKFNNQIKEISWFQDDGKSYVNLHAFIFQLFLLIENIYTIISNEFGLSEKKKNNLYDNVFPSKKYLNKLKHKIKEEKIQIKKFNKFELHEYISTIFHYETYFSAQKNKKLFKEEIFDIDEQFDHINNLISKNERNEMAHDSWENILEDFGSEKKICDLVLAVVYFIGFLQN